MEDPSAPRTSLPFLTDLPPPDKILSVADDPTSSSKKPRSSTSKEPTSCSAAASSYNPITRLSSWYWPTSDVRSEEAESRLLSRLKFFGRGSDDASVGSAGSTAGRSNTTAKIGMVNVGEGRLINTLVIEESNSFDGGAARLSPRAQRKNSNGEIDYTPTREQTKLDIERTTSTESITTSSKVTQSTKNLVMCHGYGAGLGFFYRNFHGISQGTTNLKIFAIDWLGMGRSSRVPLPPISSFMAKFRPGHTKPTIDDIVTQTEDYFVDSLEDWRKVQGLEKMTLLGHSLGGYLSAVYAIKYPERVEKLILVSPVGIPENPHIQVDPASTVDSRAAKLPGWVNYLWRSDYTPQFMIRFAGPWGPNLVQKYTDRRFAYLDDEDREALRNYIYHISASSAASEYAISRLLAPGAYAFKPLMNRLHALKTPTLFMYGDNDWMDVEAGRKAAEKMGAKSKFQIVSKAGHHLYMDNPSEFDRAILDWILDLD